MIEIGDDKFNAPLAKTWFLAKKGLKTLKAAKNSPKLNQVRLSSKFQGSSGPANDQGWWWKI